MGTWGRGPFDNDDAADWTSGLIESQNVDGVALSLEPVVESDISALSLSVCAQAVAAAEVVSAARGFPCSKFPKDVRDWLKATGFYAGRDVTGLARSAVRQVLAGSELADLWDGDVAWRRRMNNLESRLSLPSKAKRGRAGAVRGAPTHSSDQRALIKQLKKLDVEMDIKDGVIDGVDVSDSMVTASDMPMISRIESIRSFVAGYDGFGDKDLQHIARLPHLEVLVAEDYEGVTDRGMKHLGDCRSLRVLRLGGAQVSDQGLGPLAKLKNLQWLNLFETKVTTAGVRKLQAKLPAANINHQIFSGLHIPGEAYS